MSLLTERNLFLAPLQHQLSNFFLDDWSSTDMYFCTFAQRLWLKCANVCAYSFLAWTPSIFFHSNDNQPSEHIVVQMLCNCLNVQSCEICSKVQKCISAKAQKCNCCPNTVQIFTLHCTVCDGRFDYAEIFLNLNLHHAIAESHNEFLNQCLIVLAFPFPQEKTGCPYMGCNQNMIPGRFETRFPRLSDQ